MVLRARLKLLILICTAAGAFASPPAAAKAEPVRTFAGTLELRQALYFYIVNEAGADFALHLRWRDEQQTRADRPRLIRVFDPDERLLVRHEELCERVAADPPEYVRDLAVNANLPGVYQVVVSGFGGSLDFSVSPPLRWGVLGSPRLVGRGNQFEDACIYIPPGLDSLPIRIEGALEQATLADSKGAIKFESRSAGGGAVNVAGQGNEVWKFSLRSHGEYQLDFSGLPIILCPDESTARAIRASVDVLEDGTICFHKVQVKAQQILNRYRKLPRGVFALQPPQLANYRQQWQENAARNDLLLGPSGVYAALPAVLQAQNLDPDSPWFGTIAQKRNAEHPWRSYTRLGLQRVAEHGSVMAALYSIPDSFNPLHNDQVLRHRIIIAGLQELMLLREHEMPFDNLPENFFGSDQAFTFAGFMASYALVAPDCALDVREVWTEGLRRYADRESITQVASTANQWTVIMTGMQRFHEGSGDPKYAEVLQTHLRWLLTRNQWDAGHMPAGYFTEAGIDATYSGIALHNLAWLYERAKNRDLLDAIRRCINLFNHTIAPQPFIANSSSADEARPIILGVSSFACRTPDDWTQPQYGAGLAMLADDLAEAAPLADRTWPAIRTLSRAPGPRAKVEAALSSRLGYLEPGALNREEDSRRIGHGPEIHFPIWEHFAITPRKGELPMVAEREFTRNFGDEFFCVRRPGYYAFIYAGKPMPDWLQRNRPSDPRKQHPRNGGGLCMFWSPGFGSSLLAKNWSAYAAQTIIAERKSPGGGADWEDYWSIENSFDADLAQAAVTGAIMNQPLTFRRQYQFLRDRVECQVRLSASAEVALGAMWECFPYPIDPGLHLQVALVDEQNRPVNNRPAAAVVFRNGSHEAHVMVFAQPRRCQFGRDRSEDHFGKPREHGRVLAELPAQWKTGQEHAVRWTILAVSGDQVAPAIQEAIAFLNR